MQETINVIESALAENKEIIRRLSTEQDNFIKALSEGNFKKEGLLNINMKLEVQLKSIYEQMYTGTKDACNFKSATSGYIDNGGMLKRD